MSHRQLHPKTKQELDGCLSHNRIANGYLFFGASYANLEDVADYFIRTLLGIDQDSFFPTDQFMQIDAEKEIKKDAIEEIIHRVRYGPPTGRAYLVVWIHHAHRLNTSASNVLLKTLEEPPDGVVFVLTTHHLQGVMPTIQSRCQLIPCRPVLMDKNLQEEEASMSLGVFVQLSIEERLDAIQSFSLDKQVAEALLLQWLQDAVDLVVLQKNTSFFAYELLIEKIECFQYNINARLHLEELALSI